MKKLSLILACSLAFVFSVGAFANDKWLKDLEKRPAPKTLDKMSLKEREETMENSRKISKGCRLVCEDGKVVTYDGNKKVSGNHRCIAGAYAINAEYQTQNHQTLKTCGK